MGKMMEQGGGQGHEASSPDEKVRQAVDGLIAAFRSADPDAGQMHVHLPTTEIIEWKGLANIWHASVDEFRETVEAHREEPITQESIEESIEWLSPLTAVVRRGMRTSLPDGRSFVSPALFIVTPDREGSFKVALSWWGAFPDWFQGN
jgi:hypothetical protein